MKRRRIRRKPSGLPIGVVPARIGWGSRGRNYSPMSPEFHAEVRFSVSFERSFCLRFHESIVPPKLHAIFALSDCLI
jgi:hypothetical protein